MRLFFKRLAAFTLFIILVFFIVLEGLSLANKRLLRKYKADAGFNTVLSGDSHIQNAINDNELTGVINLSQTAESFLFSYTKLKLILESHPHVKRVLLGCGYHNFSGSYIRNWVIGKRSYPVATRYFFILPARQRYWLLWNHYGGVYYLRSSMKTGFYNITNSSGHHSFTGFYREGGEMAPVLDIENIKKRVNQIYYNNGELDNFSSINILYIDKIIELCKSRNVELVILNTPLSARYKELVPQKFKDKYYSFLNNKVRLLEFDNLNLSDSCFVSDGEHLSGKGAAIATAYLKSFLKQ